jgi:hypothetical protein
MFFTVTEHQMLNRCANGFVADIGNCGRKLNRDRLAHVKYRTVRPTAPLETRRVTGFERRVYEWRQLSGTARVSLF